MDEEKKITDFLYICKRIRKATINDLDEINQLICKYVIEFGRNNYMLENYSKKFSKVFTDSLID